MLVPVFSDDQPPDVPYVTFAIIIVNVAVYCIFASNPHYGHIVRNWGYVPSRESPLTTLTSQFLHGSVEHLLGNMLFLWVVGTNMEWALGKIGFLAFYLACGCFADFTHGKLVAHEMLSQPCIGASGAIAGALGAFILLFPFNRIRFFVWILIAHWTFTVPAYVPIALWFVQQFMLGSHIGQVSDVAYGAHVGGFLIGMLAATLLVMLGLVEPKWKRKQRPRKYW